MNFKNIRPDILSLIMCFTTSLVTILYINLSPSKSNLTCKTEVINGVEVCINPKCQDSPYHCNDESCVGTDYHIEVCLKDSI